MFVKTDPKTAILLEKMNGKRFGSTNEMNVSFNVRDSLLIDINAIIEVMLNWCMSSFLTHI